MRSPPGSTMSPVASGSRPIAPWRNSGRRMSEPNIATMPTAMMPSGTLNPRCVNTRRSSRARSSRCRTICRHANAASARTPRASGTAGGTTGVWRAASPMLDSP
ncbi:Uncharacterised protein [Mycobacteroides abscessus]|nr:Uncharacterised protein [Mycobacteroides abscessus]